MSALDLNQVQNITTDKKGRVSRPALVRALIKAGLEKETAYTHAAGFFSAFDVCGKGKVPLEAFITEYQRMATFQVILAFTASSKSSFSLQDVQNELKTRVGPTASQGLADQIFRTLDADDSGELSMDELRSWHLKALAEQKRVREGNARTVAQKTFDKFDKDKSGHLDLKELAALSNSLGQTLDDAEVKSAFAAIDNSNDGQITFDEFFAWFSDNEPSKKSLKATAALKARLKLTQGSSWMETMATKLDAKSIPGTVDISVSYGAIEEVKASATVTYESTHVLDAKMLKKFKVPTEGNLSTEEGKGAIPIFTFDFKMRDMKSVSSLRSVLLAATNAMALVAASESDAPKMRFHVAKDEALLRFTCVFKHEDMPVPNDLWPIVEGITSTVEFGYNPQDIFSQWETFTIWDLLSMRATSTGLKFPAEVFDPAAAQALESYTMARSGMENMGVTLPETMPIVQELVDGKAANGGKIEFDFSPLVESALKPAFQQGLEESGLEDMTGFEEEAKRAKEGKLHAFVKLALFGEGGALTSGWNTSMAEQLMPTEAGKMMMRLIARDIDEVSAVHMRYPNGKGFSLRMNGIAQPAAIDNLLTKVFPETGVASALNAAQDSDSDGDW